MTTKFFDNFNFDPVSTTAESGTYNLPAGAYARLIPIGYEAALVADGVELLSRRSYSQYYSIASAPTTWINVETVSAETRATGVVELLNPGPHGAAEYRIINEFGVATYSNSNNSSTVPQYTNVTLSPKDRIELRNNSILTGSQITIHAYADDVNIPQYFWVTGGNSGITITGDKFVVELYNKQGN